MSSILHNDSKEDGPEWWQYIRRNSFERPKEDLLGKLLETEEKIRFFEDLLEEKQQKYHEEKLSKIENYELYVNNLEKLYKEELKQAKKINEALQKIEEENKEDSYRELRKEINKDGQKGLNFSPKQPSVFSGASDTILLSKTSSFQNSIRRGENFSFGSIKRNKVRQQSLERASIPFLNPGRACVAKRQLDFDEL